VDSATESVGLLGDGQASRPSRGAGDADGSSIDRLIRAMVATQPSEVSELPLQPTRVGRYRLGERLGRGTFGVVYEAVDELLGRTVAVKLPRRMADAQLRALSLTREAQLLGRLSHRNVVTLHDYGLVDGAPYMVLERLRGQTLEELLLRGRLDARTALAVATDVARGLAHAHEKGIVHADIKPGNIFICDDGTAKLLDFGLGCHQGGDLVAVFGGGTPAYMSPEQWRRQPPTPASDVFAIGALLYHLLTGQQPFNSDDDAADLQAPLPRGLDALVARALCDEPGARFADCGELLAALVSYLGQTSPRQRTRRRPEARRTSSEREGAQHLLAANLALARTRLRLVRARVA
jgi:serine/threonine protein kinase